MLLCTEFANICKEFGLTFFTGVPDSTYKSWMYYLDKERHGFANISTVNECEATAVAAGYHLATRNYAIVYMQNSGFGKTVNPLTSLCGQDMYRIPVLLMIGWRGEPGKKDAHQHRQMGRITTRLLDEMDIAYEIISDTADEVRGSVQRAIEHMEKTQLPFALIVRKGVFEDLDVQASSSESSLSREVAIHTILRYIHAKDIVVSTTGKTTRELNEAYLKNNWVTPNTFYNPGAMGCASSIGLGIALQKPGSNVFVFDGDGALLMQMGSLTTIAKQKPINYRHIIFDNNAHESTGSQQTNSDVVQFDSLAKSCGYNMTWTVNDEKELHNVFPSFIENPGPSMLIINIKTGSRADLSRPKEKPEVRKEKFIKFVELLP